MPIDLDSELDRLYGLPLEGFVAGRDELVKRLREEDRREEGEQVKALRKPPVAVWLVNRLARERELDVRRLLDAGEALRKAQSGGDADEFSAARRDEHHALERLVGAARELAEREGSGQTAIDRATQTLRAAAVSDEGRELLRRGRLSEELEPPGFEALTGLVLTQPRKARKAPPRPSKQARERVKRLRQAEKDAEAAARAVERDADRAEQEAAKLRKRAAEARAKAEAATAAREAAEP